MPSAPILVVALALVVGYGLGCGFAGYELRDRHYVEQERERQAAIRVAHDAALRDAGAVTSQLRNAEQQRDVAMDALVKERKAKSGRFIVGACPAPEPGPEPGPQAVAELAVIPSAVLSPDFVRLFDRAMCGGQASCSGSSDDSSSTPLASADDVLSVTEANGASWADCRDALTAWQSLASKNGWEVR